MKPRGLILNRIGAAAAWGCLLSSLCLSIGALPAIAAPQQNTNPAPHRKATATAKSLANSAEFKKLAARAKDAREQNRLKEAADLYQKALQLNPRWEEGWWYLGTLDYDANNYSNGVKAFSNLVELDRQDAPGWALLGLCEFAIHDYGNAYVHLEMAKSKGRALNDELWHVVEYHLALLDILHSDFEAADTLLADLVDHNIFSQDVERAIGLTVLRVPLLPNQVDPEKDALISEAGRTGELMALEDFNDADVSFQHLLHDYPTTPFVHYAYAAMLFGLSQYAKAGEELREEVKLNPESAMPRLLLAFVNIRLDRPKDALPLAQEAVKLAPQSFAAHYLLGRADLGVDKVTDAANQLSIAKRLAPENAQVRYSLALALTRAKRPQEAAAEEAEFRRLSALVRRERSGGASEVKNSSGNSSEPGEIGLDQLQSPPVRSPHQ